MRRFAPITIAGTRDHDGLDEVITMAGMRSLSAQCNHVVEIPGALAT
jgi:hypothetical protein